MNPQEFFKLVEQMRYQQKEYFKTKSQTALRYSKDLEKRIDDEIKRVNKILEEKQQPKLF